MRTGLFGQPAVWALAKVAKPKLAQSNAPAQAQAKAVALAKRAGLLNSRIK
jgi:hypothetical protein